ncbi:MAG: YfcE family phosphodiesterase, partial [Eubacteriales bacterium]|nr:YfcE family phosphodiesterase [Eubacteriales bacterium]
MNLFVISDTHGTIERALEMFRRVTDSGTRIDGVLHAGDLLRDADAFAKEVRLPLWNVPGNCDGCFERNYQILDLPSGRLLLTHGHMEQADLSHQNLYYLAEEQACSAVCFGHTHVAEIRNIGGID